MGRESFIPVRIGHFFFILSRISCLLLRERTVVGDKWILWPTPDRRYLLGQSALVQLSDQGGRAETLMEHHPQHGWSFFSTAGKTCTGVRRANADTTKSTTSRAHLSYCWSPNFVPVDRVWLAVRLSPPIRYAPGTDLVLLIAYMCPCSLEINIGSSSFLHFWRGERRKSQDLVWTACSAPKKANQEAPKSEFCSMQGPGTECGLSIGLDAFLLSFKTNRVPLYRLSLCLCPPGQNSGISSTVRSRYKRQLIRLNRKKKWPKRTGMEDSRLIFCCKRFSYYANALYQPRHGIYKNSRPSTRARHRGRSYPRQCLMVRRKYQRCNCKRKSCYVA